MAIPLLSTPDKALVATTQNFPVQIMVRSQKKDISIYMEFLQEAQSKIKNQLLYKLMTDYRTYIQDAIKKRNVLSKKFYIAVVFTPYELGIAKSVVSTVSFGQKQRTLPYPKSYVTRKAKVSLYPKRDHLMRQATRLGVRLKPLSDDELLRLFYGIYNPEPPVKEEGGFGGGI
ncbi:MAG: hypothetical protein US53_C0072G0002 [Candidatus Woesebacteria bacterium GW2011_GWA1_37_7]|uniref:Uncharacterized protein n=1 Tax=Candidatus Woesebacteria bacterium GW2011_GWA1_37_7 TaxID=1618545 RepID=A0A0G0GXL8_9BACT|nr:MAG: hypothetical protein US53_C0072G0002 [Candidatus Woesebacteria bacterium GW2011_GWA1_37_7]